jgi:hypothetical protein
MDRIATNYFPAESKILLIHTGGIQGIEGMNTRLRKNNYQLMPMFKKILLLLTILTLLSCNVTKPVIVTKKAVPSSSKKVATRA